MNDDIDLTFLSVCKALLLTFNGISVESITPLKGKRYLGTISFIESLTNTWLQNSLISPFSQSALPDNLGKYKIPCMSYG